MKRILLLLSITFLLFGCSSQTQVAPKYDVSGRFLGLTTADLVQIKGAPGAVAVLPAGGSVWTYKSSMTTENAGQKVLSWIETTSFMIDINGTVNSYTTAVE